MSELVSDQESCSRGTSDQVSDSSTRHSADISIDHRRVLFERYRHGIGKVIANRISSLYDRGDGYRFIKDILPGTTLRDAKEITRKIKETHGNRLGNTWAVVYHPETETQGHIHLFHRCLYYGSYCRCSPLRGLRPKRRRARYTPVLGTQNNQEFWQLWFRYFLQEPRQIVYLEIAGMDFGKQVRRLENLRPSQQTEGVGSDELVEGSWPPCQGADRQPTLVVGESQEDREVAQRIGAAVNSRNINSTGVRSLSQGMKPANHKNPQSILNALYRLLVIPIESSCETEEWLANDDLLFINKSDSDYKRACSAFARRTQFLDFHSLYAIHSRPETVGIYFQRSHKHYFNLEESYAHCYRLLYVQYGSASAVTQFISRLYDILERALPKKNTMYVEGPPNSGKSWFFDMVTSYYLNIGHVKNFVRQHSFPLNDCVSRRVLMWNEPSISPSQFETFKMLAGGDPCPAAIKYEGDGKITRTPLLLTANHCAFDKSNPVWSSRMYFETWKSAPFLKELQFYPHPLTWYKLVSINL